MMNHESRTGVNENRPSPGTGLMGPAVPSGLAEAAERALARPVVGLSPCAGGDINSALRLDLEGGETAFLKYRAGAGVDEFKDEAAALGWLAEPDVIPVPRVLAVLEQETCPGLILQWLDPGPALAASGEEDLARGLTGLHRSGADFHGQRAPGSSSGEVRLGRATLVAAGSESPESGFSGLYASRLEDLARQASRNGAIDREGAAAISSLAEQIERFSGPALPPSRLHGDLWSGNVLADRAGHPWLIDPASYGGHPEVDLAMLDLFGTLSPRFLAAYEEVSPLPEGRSDRISLWQIQPLLVHAVLFGGHYGGAAARNAVGYIGR